MKDLFCLFMSPYTYVKVINATQSTTAVGPWHLKVVEDTSLTKNYCITIRIQKISAIHKLILKMQQI